PEPHGAGLVGREAEPPPGAEADPADPRLVLHPALLRTQFHGPVVTPGRVRRVVLGRGREELRRGRAAGGRGVVVGDGRQDDPEGDHYHQERRKALDPLHHGPTPLVWSTRRRAPGTVADRPAVRPASRGFNELAVSSSRSGGRAAGLRPPV